MTTRLGGWKNNLETKGTFEATNQWGIVLTPNGFATHITNPRLLTAASKRQSTYRANGA